MNTKEPEMLPKMGFTVLKHCCALESFIHWPSSGIFFLYIFRQGNSLTLGYKVKISNHVQNSSTENKGKLLRLWITQAKRSKGKENKYDLPFRQKTDVWLLSWSACCNFMYICFDFFCLDQNPLTRPKRLKTEKWQKWITTANFQ